MGAAGDRVSDESGDCRVSFVERLNALGAENRHRNAVAAVNGLYCEANHRFSVVEPRDALAKGQWLIGRGHDEMAAECRASHRCLQEARVAAGLCETCGGVRGRHRRRHCSYVCRKKGLDGRHVFLAYDARPVDSVLLS